MPMEGYTYKAWAISTTGDSGSNKLSLKAYPANRSKGRQEIFREEQTQTVSVSKCSQHSKCLNQLNNEKANLKNGC